MTIIKIDDKIVNEDAEFCQWMFRNHLQLYLKFRRDFNKEYELGQFNLN